MRVVQVGLHGCMTHDDTVVELPETGIVTVSGPNGSGKSALVEAVAAALWGKTLRGTPPWGAAEPRSKDKASVFVEAVGKEQTHLTVKRSKTAKGSPKLDVQAFDNAWPEYLRTKDETTAVAYAFGEFDQWRYTHVFSASDAAAFMLSSDGECKRLIEGMLGLDRFDPALAACRKDAAKAESELRDAERGLLVLAQRVESEQRRLGEAQADLAKFAPAPKPLGATEDPSAIEERIDDAEEELALLGQNRNELNVLRSRVLAEAQHAAQAADRLNADACPTCGQRIAPELRAAADEEANAKLLGARNQERAIADDTRKIDQRAAELRQLLGELRVHLHEARKADAELLASEQQFEREAQQRAELERRAKDAAGKLAWLEDEQDAARSKLEQWRKRLGVLRAAEKVLGLRGVRATVLGRALGGIEAAANDWLEQLFPGARLRLSSSLDQRNGVTVDKIARILEGEHVLEHDYGYKACSSGQRRRVDLAVLLALAEVSGASRGESVPGTMWLDEVLDAIDDEGGLDAAMEVVEELANDRCVVIISHRREVLDRLRAARRLRVEEGRVTG